MLNAQTIKLDFPIFRHHPGLVYLDSAATSLKPHEVINAEKEYLERYSANVGRGLYPLAEIATGKFEAARETVARFIGTTDHREIIFTSGTTASINLVAQLLEKNISANDNIVITAMEHHSNYLPWKELVRRRGAELRIIPLTDEGILDLSVLKQLVDEHTAVIALTAVSNVLGTINPVSDIIATAKSNNPKILALVDAAQAIGHMPVDVTAWNADFVAFSGHKMFGPTGIGVLYGRSSVLETLAPAAFGGGMVLDMCTAPTLYKEIPHRFEAGTPNITGAIALDAAIQYIENLGLENIRAHERELVAYAIDHLRETFGDTITIVGPKEAEKRGGIIAFSFEGIHPHDIAHLLGEHDICVRAGEHCAAPLHRALHLDATTRLSFSVYNSNEDINVLIAELQLIQQKLKM